MAKIIVNNPRQVINGGAKKYYFKVKGLGGPKGDKGDKGDTGSQGPQGPQGNAATISVGSTTTLPVGYNATVENVGSIYNAVLNFGIPQGPQGPQGATGAKGDKGDKGEQGNPGPQGEKGTNATVTVGTTTTTEPGTQAYAWNSSSNPNNAVINFDIPRGATGPQGPQGVQGPTGPAGADGKSFTPVVVSSLPSTGTEGKLYLTPKNYTTGTATGNPITISLDEDAGQVTSFQLDGDTFQQSYTGKNLFDAANADIREQYILNDSGVEVSDRTGGYTRNYSKVEPSTGYILSGLDTIGGKARRVYYYDENKGFISRSAQITTGTPTLTFTTPANCYFVNIQIFYPDDLDTSSWQLEAGSSATAYEPYVGGQASPNPDYPQQIQTVTGEQTVTVVGKNLIDPDGLELGNIDASGDDSASQQFVRSGYIRVAAGSYTLKVNNSDNNIKLWRYAIYDNSKTFVSANTPQDKSAAITITNNGYIRVSFYNVPWKDLTVQEIIDSQVQLELGSTASPYATYSKHTYPINLGKNLFDNTGWEQGQYSNGAWGGGNTKRATSGFIPVEGGIYTMSLNSTDRRTALINLNYFDGAKTWLGNRTTLGLELFGYTDRVKTFTLPNNARYLRVTVRPYGGDDQGDNIIQYAPSENLQVEAGSTATTYAPYFTPIELCKLGGYQDYIYKDGDDWKVHKEVGKYTFTDVSGFIWGSDRNRLYIGQTALAELGINFVPPASQTSKFYALSEKFKVEAFDTGYAANYTGACFICSFGQTWSFRGGWSNETEARNALANTTAHYALATPTDTTITDTNLISQLEAIRTASLENGTNTITNTATDTNLAGGMEIGYYGFNPTNRYDKFIWLDINNNYEQIGGE